MEKIRAIALTGGIAEGKSTVLSMCRDLGAKVASADEIGRQVFESQEVQVALADLLGVPDGRVRPEQVRAALAADSEIRYRVNQITHPKILAGIFASGADVIEVPLLIETCIHELFDEVWVVTCGPEIQRERLISRLKNEVLADQILATQLPTRAKIPFASVVVRTNNPPSDVLAYVSRHQSRWTGLQS